MSMPLALGRIFDSKQRSARRLARVRLREARKLMRRARGALSDSARSELRQQVAELSAARKEGNVAAMHKQADKLATLSNRHLATFRKPAWRESFESILVAVLVALLLRSFVVEAFKIPSGSMIPTLAIGDQIFVNKYIYGVRIPFTAVRLVNFAEPKRGEVIVFMVPLEPHEDYIKRVIGIPGDEVMVRRGQVYINGAPVPHKALGRVTELDRDGVSGPWHTFDAYAFQETLDGNTYTVLQDANVSVTHSDFGPFVVPEGHVFVMGDNRDHSFDSRAWQPGGMAVPEENILGRSLFVWWSWGKGGWWLWGDEGLRFGRLGTWID